MIIYKTDIISKIRTAIDDIAPSVLDSFGSDVNTELWQATIHATIALSAALPLNLLDVSIDQMNGTVDSNRGFAYGPLPDDYLRFANIDIADTSGVLSELVEPGSDMEKMQRSSWSRGSASKPKAMLDNDETGKKVIVWWPGTDTHSSAQLSYVKKPIVVTETTTGYASVPAINCAIRDEAEPQVIYQAAAIFFEGKKEPDTAEKFRNM